MDPAALREAVDDIAAQPRTGWTTWWPTPGGTVGQRQPRPTPAPGEFTATFALNAGHAAELIQRRPRRTCGPAGRGAVVIISSITGHAARRRAPPTPRPRRRRSSWPRRPRRNWPRTTSGSTRSARARSCSRAAGGTSSAERQPGGLRHVPGHPVPVPPAGPSGRSGRRDHVPAVPAGLLGHRQPMSSWTAGSATRAPAGSGASAPSAPPSLMAKSLTVNNTFRACEQLECDV